MLWEASRLLFGLQLRTFPSTKLKRPESRRNSEVEKYTACADPSGYGILANSAFLEA
jgi:hypothetical protein